MHRLLPWIAIVGLASGCGGAQSSMSSRESAQPVDVVVTSGLPQPAPKDVAVRVGEPVVLRVEGLGPARAIVLAPDGSRVATTDAPLVRQTAVGTEQRFTPAAAGTYRVEHAEVPGLELARLVAK